MVSVSVSRVLVSVSRSIEIRQVLQQEMHAFLISKQKHDSTAVDWGSFCRDLFIEYFVQNINPVKLSGVVEIGESLFGRRTKYHRGMSRGHKVWIFGLV